MILSRLSEVKREYERTHNRRVTYKDIMGETGISETTISRLMDPRKEIDRIAGHTLSELCRFFGCTSCDLIEYVPDVKKEPLS